MKWKTLCGVWSAMCEWLFHRLGLFNALQSQQFKPKQFRFRCCPSIRRDIRYYVSSSSQRCSSLLVRDDRNSFYNLMVFFSSYCGCSRADTLMSVNGSVTQLIPLPASKAWGCKALNNFMFDLLTIKMEFLMNIHILNHPLALADAWCFAWSEWRGFIEFQISIFLSLFIFIERDQCCNCRTLMRWDDLLTSFSFSTTSMQPSSQCCNRNSLFSGVLLRAGKKSFVKSDYSTGISYSTRILSALSIFAFSTIRKNIYIFRNVFTCLYCYRVESGERSRSLMRDI